MQEWNKNSQVNYCEFPEDLVVSLNGCYVLLSFFLFAYIYSGCTLGNSNELINSQN